MGKGMFGVQIQVAHEWKSWTEYDYEDDRKVEITLPENTTDVRLDIQAGDAIVEIGECRGYAGFWYDIHLEAEGIRLANRLFLIGKETGKFSCEEFRFQTTKISICYKSCPVTEAIAGKMSEGMKKQQDLTKEFEDKWLNQVKVYDEKVSQVVKLEQDKVVLGQAIEDLKKERDFWHNQYQAMENSSSWKLTAPIRDFNQKMAGLKNKQQFEQQKKQFAEMKKTIGFAQAEKEFFTPFVQECLEVFGQNTGLQERTESIQPEENQKKVSLLCIVKNRDQNQTLKLVGLLMSQTYQNFEVLLLDQSDKEHASGTAVCRWIAKEDSRVQYHRLSGTETTSEIINSFLPKCTGDYIGILNQGDVLDVRALALCITELTQKQADFVYTDHSYYDNSLKEAENPWYKPDYSPDYLRSRNYIGRFWLASRELFGQIEKDGMLCEPECDGDWNYNLILKLTESAEQKKKYVVAHVPELLCFQKTEKLEEQTANQRLQADHTALKNHLSRLGIRGNVQDVDEQKGLYKIDYEIIKNSETGAEPLISILIPNKDHVSDLKKCLESVLHKSTYSNYEIIVIENNSAKKETFDYYKELEQNEKIRVVQWKEGFNYSAINNFGAGFAKGEYLLLLNNDMEIITPEWMEEMLQYAQRTDVGITGAKLYYPDDTVQHAGVIIGLGGVAAHSHKDADRSDPGYMDRLLVTQNLSAVTAACLMVRKEIFQQVKELDERFAVAFNDADFCMKVRRAGYLVVFTPFVELYHDESKSRGIENTPEKAERFESEIKMFKKAWPEILENGDPYYNRNLTPDREDFSVRE